MSHEWLTYREAAGELGVSVCTLQRRIEARLIRPVRPKDGKPRVDRKELNAYRAAAEGSKYQLA